MVECASSILPPLCSRSRNPSSTNCTRQRPLLDYDLAVSLRNSITCWNCRLNQRVSVDTKTLQWAVEFENGDWIREEEARSSCPWGSTAEACYRKRRAVCIVWERCILVFNNDFSKFTDFSSAAARDQQDGFVLPLSRDNCNYQSI